jgi:hypothetical protein
MKESHGKDPASHPDPESCVGDRKGAGEALTGAHAGQPLNCEIRSSGVPTLLREGEGHMVGGVTGEPLADPTQSKTLSMRGNSLHGNREIPGTSIVAESMDRLGKGTPHNPNRYVPGKSDDGIVPEKSPNRGRRPAEAMEGRPSTKGNLRQPATSPTQSGNDVTSGWQRVRAAVTLLREHPR